MGSHIAVWLDSADDLVAARAFQQAEARFASNEEALSRFRPDSELSQLNARSGGWVAVSDLLWRELTLSVEMAAMTEGSFDPTVLKALTQAGYDQSFEMMAMMPSSRWQNPGRDIAFNQGQWAAIEFDEDRQAVRVPAGVHLDLGGIAKGDTAEQVVDMLRDAGPCLVDAGGDLVAGAAPADLPGWPVAISAPRGDASEEQDDLVTLWLAERALATSGVEYRRWLLNGQPMHHLIDPRTGWPADTDGLTVSVLAGRAAVAEAWATAALIAGSTRGVEILASHSIAGLMVTRAGQVLVTPTMHHQLLGLIPTPYSPLS